MKKILSLICTLGVSTILFAQDDVQLSQFNSNKLYYNPAATGYTDHFFASASYRAQWAGSQNMAKKDRPGYVLFNATQFFWDQRSGVGLTVYDARQSVNKTFQAKLSYAYHLQVQEGAYLAMGISAGVLSRGIDGAITPEGNYVDYRNAMNTDLGLGLEYYTPEIVVGLSVSHLPLVLGREEARIRTHFYYYMTYYYSVNRDWRIIPTLVLRNSGFITNFDVNVRVSYLNKFLIGASYRLDAIAIMAGININDSFSLGYSYDFNQNILKTNGIKASHEIVLSYKGMLLREKSTIERIKDQRDF